MSSNNSKSKAVMEFQRKLFASRFFTISVLLHFILVVAFGGTVLFQRYSEPPDFTGEEGGGFVSADTASSAAPPPQASEVAPEMTVSTPVPSANPTDITAITTSAVSDVSFTMPAIAPPVISPTASMNTSMAASSAPSMSGASLTAAQSREIAAFTGGWAKKGGSGGGPGSSPRTREFEFTAYLAKYGDPNDPQRGGDWASTNWLREGKIVGGSLPNLLYYMNKMSRDKIKAAPNAVPLELSSQEIFAKKPPFIFFTGHRDFVLTNQEVENLRKYISLGGCVWGDSSLPGRRSRFDIAFRREMRRVISDADKDWEKLPPNHAMFTKNLYYQEIKEPPTGMNFYKEPVYALKFAGEVAIIYTANDYGDMWQIGVDEKGQPDMSVDEKGRHIAMNIGIWNRRNLYYRNIEMPAVINTYKFGTNVVIHLLTRWEDRVRGVPTGL